MFFSLIRTECIRHTSIQSILIAMKSSQIGPGAFLTRLASCHFLSPPWCLGDNLSVVEAPYIVSKSHLIAYIALAIKLTVDLADNEPMTIKFLICCKHRGLDTSEGCFNTDHEVVSSRLLDIY